MRRIVAIFLLLAFVALATGIPQRIHQQQHDCRDCRMALLELIRHHGVPVAPKPHTDHACLICALLYAPALASSPPVVMIDAGACPAQVAELSPPQINPVVPIRLTCRGPPAC